MNPKSREEFQRLERIRTRLARTSFRLEMAELKRTQSGLNRAKAEGKTLGRPARLSEQQKQPARDELAAGVSVSALARKLGTSRQTVMRARAADS